MDLINLPYCFLFIPLILSCFNTLQNYKATNLIITIGCASFLLLLGLYLVPATLPNIVLENKINNNVLFIMGEYKITIINLIFIIMVFFVKLLSFTFFDDQMLRTKKLNFFFAIYLINYFAICGILTSNNIFNIFIYMELYSFSLYNILSDYKIRDYNKVAFQYYNNGVLGSIFFMFFVFIVYFTFGTSDISYIARHLSLVSENYIYNLSIIIFLFGVLFKFFSFNFYFSNVLKSSELSNLLFINILFGDVIIGIYILWKFLFSLFDINVIFNIFHVNYIFYIIGSCLIIYNSYLVFKRQNLLPVVYSFSLITLGYILILFGLNNAYGFVGIVSFLINHILFNFLFYIIAALCINLFKKSDTPLLYAFYKYRFIVYTVVLSKLLFPIAFSFNSYWSFMLSAIQNKQYYLFIPIIFEKVIMVFLFVRYYFVFVQDYKEEHNYLDLTDKIKLNNSYVVTILILVLLIIGISFFEGNIFNVLLNFSVNGGIL
ncbi:MAG: proton-conducting transporter membrane subunit [Rickettsiales bacterium]|nr:proton-conducting transporter membrane subunit [Rickettsiales bacterium]